MAEGRFISRRISYSEQLASVSLEADFLFSRCIPHLDVAGRITGNAVLLKAQVAPLRPEITAETIPTLIHELEEAIGPEGEPLVIQYQVGTQWILAFPGFARIQKGLRKDREAESRLPAPPITPPKRRRTSDHPRAARRSTPELLRDDAGSTPESSGPTPAEVKRSLSQDKSKYPADAGPDAPRGGYPAEFAALLKPIGLFEVPRVGKALRPLVDEYGLDRAREMVTAYAQFAPHMDRTGQVDPKLNQPQFCSPEKLAQTAGFWRDYTAPIPTGVA